MELTPYYNIIISNNSRNCEKHPEKINNTIYNIKINLKNLPKIYYLNL